MTNSFLIFTAERILFILVEDGGFKSEVFWFIIAIFTIFYGVLCAARCFALQFTSRSWAIGRFLTFPVTHWVVAFTFTIYFINTT